MSNDYKPLTIQETNALKVESAKQRLEIERLKKEIKRFERAEASKLRAKKRQAKALIDCGLFTISQVKVFTGLEAGELKRLNF